MRNTAAKTPPHQADAGPKALWERHLTPFHELIMERAKSEENKNRPDLRWSLRRPVSRLI
jgi:hypothetical protein